MNQESEINELLKKEHKMHRCKGFTVYNFQDKALICIERKDFLEWVEIPKPLEEGRIFEDAKEWLENNG